jgi:hypothetical protein
MSGCVLVVGLGDIGEHVLEVLTRTPGISRIVGTDINEESSLRRIYSARSGGAHLNFYPKVEFQRLDVNDIDQTEKMLNELVPDVIITSVTMMTWWMAGAQLPQETFEKIDQAGFGPWTPLHLTLTHKFAQALKRSGLDAPWINASYPDVVNCVLGKVGMAPLVGLGNMDLMIPGIQHAAAKKLGLPMRNIQVYLVADHFIVHHLNAYSSTGGAPYFLKIHANGRDATARLDLERVLIEANRYMPKGREDHFIVAASAVKNALAALNDSHILTHSPGPRGLPGGYPITIGRKSAEVALPEGIEKEEAIGINQQAQKFDGIDEIKKDGTIVFTQKSVDVMKKMLNYECKTLSLNECENRADELLRLYRDFLISETKP